MGHWGVLRATAAVAAILAAGVMPASEAGHCETAISVYGRSALTPGVVPPRAPVGQICADIESPNAPGHALPPASDQVYVRVEADLGPSYPVLLMWLQGQGFQGQQFALTRTEPIAGSVVYVPEDWLSIPDPDADDGITATVRYPGGHLASVHYAMSPLDATA